jgi:hypothetical protein
MSFNKPTSCITRQEIHFNSPRLDKPEVTGGRNRSCSDSYYVSRESVCGNTAIHGDGHCSTPSGVRQTPRLLLKHPSPWRGLPLNGRLTC